jgi:hypothetical protein
MASKPFIKDFCRFITACYSCLNVMKFLHKAYPESISLLGSNARSSLHLISDENSDVAVVADIKVQYLCDQCPALIHLKDGKRDTALYDLLTHDDSFNSDCVKTLCNVDATVVKDKCFSLDTTKMSSVSFLYIASSNLGLKFRNYQ